MTCLHTENHIRCAIGIANGKFCDFHINEHSFSKFVERVRQVIVLRVNQKIRVTWLCKRHPGHASRLSRELKCQTTNRGVIRLQKVIDEMMNSTHTIQTSLSSMVWVHGIMVECT
jgi:hypothetical protein